MLFHQKDGERKIDMFQMLRAEDPYTQNLTSFGKLRA